MPFCDFNTVGGGNGILLSVLSLSILRKYGLDPYTAVCLINNKFLGKNLHLYILSVNPFFIVHMQQLKVNHGQFQLIMILEFIFLSPCISLFVAYFAFNFTEPYERPGNATIRDHRPTHGTRKRHKTPTATWQ